MLGIFRFIGVRASKISRELRGNRATINLDLCRQWIRSSQPIILNSAVAGLKMAHLLKITLSFLSCGAHPDGARV
jgi:hypothetical protein